MDHKSERNDAVILSEAKDPVSVGAVLRLSQGIPTRTPMQAANDFEWKGILRLRRCFVIAKHLLRSG